MSKIRCGTCREEYEAPARFRVCPLCVRIDILFGNPTRETE